MLVISVLVFRSGDEGAIVSEYSTRSRDEFDIFTDPHNRRAILIQKVVQ